MTGVPFTRNEGSPVRVRASALSEAPVVTRLSLDPVFGCSSDAGLLEAIWKPCEPWFRQPTSLEWLSCVAAEAGRAPKRQREAALGVAQSVDTLSPASAIYQQWDPITPTHKTQN